MFHYLVICVEFLWCSVCSVRSSKLIHNSHHFLLSLHAPAILLSVGVVGGISKINGTSGCDQTSSKV